LIFFTTFIIEVRIKEKILKANWEDSKIQGETLMNKEDFLENAID